MFLFGHPKKVHSKTNAAIVSPIRQHIRQVDVKLKARSAVGKSKSHADVVNDQKRFQRMRFMGIPTRPVQKASDKEIRTIVAKISQTSIWSQELPPNLNKSTRYGEQTESAKAKLTPRIPDFDCTTGDERERLKVDKFVSFERAQPRGTNARNLRVDKSLPWIEDELHAARVKLEKESKSRKTFASEVKLADEGIAASQSKKEIDADTSAIKNSYKEIIASKLQCYKEPNVESSAGNEHDDGDGILSAVESKSSLSSAGTYFTNDSGSFLIEMDKKIPKSEMNLQKKFQVSNHNRSFLELCSLPQCWSHSRCFFTESQPCDNTSCTVI